ncbi:hypothetical protein [Kitasatospora kifunensis]|uniref:Uncharacterized protein n=1 Tax=Kitasatospora kifunensis TaxID=58351 RepID=A0A7W7R723_KITKI|nr:hypothetical protein [Kitasatospora kifunensis]MBB4926036.1 hypothetical protein [Kitasatospora kifunensis]
MSWETALASFASKTPTDTTKITKPTDVAGTSSSWVASCKAFSQDPYTAVSGYDFWAQWSFTDDNKPADNRNVVVGVLGDWSQWGDGSNGSTMSPLGSFYRDPQHILSPLIWNPGANGTTSASSFIAASDVVVGVDSWISDWLPRMQAWADSIGGSDSDMQGSAAWELKRALMGCRGELVQLQTSMNKTKVFAELTGTNGNLTSAINKLWQLYQTWLGNTADESIGSFWTAKTLLGDMSQAQPTSRSLAWPAACMYEAFVEMMQGVTCSYQESNSSYTFAGTSPLPSDASFADTLSAKAKQKWLDNVTAVLSTPADAIMSQLTTQYGDLVPPTIRVKWVAPFEAPPSTTGPGTDGPGSTGPGGDGGGAGGGGGGTGGKDGPGGNGPKVDLGPGGIGGGGSGGGIGGGGKGGGLGGGGKGGGGPIGLGGGGIGGGGGLGGGGKGGGGIGGGPIGLGGGGIGGGLGGGGTGGGLFGGNAKVPAGSTVNPDGTVTIPGGTLLRDQYGNLVKVPKGGSIGKDGSILDPSGKQVSNEEQLLADEENSLSSPGGTGRIGPGESFTGEGEDFGGGGLGGLGSIGSTGSKSLSGLGKGLLGEGEAAPQPRLTVGGPAGPASGFGIGGRMAKGGAPLTPEEEMAAKESGALAGEEVAANSAEEAQMMGRSMSTTGGGGAPMMPPPGGAGAGAGGQGEKERQRTTWLSEDEEVWGTESSAVSGVIGR